MHITNGFGKVTSTDRESLEHLEIKGRVSGYLEGEGVNGQRLWGSVVKFVQDVQTVPNCQLGESGARE